MDLDTPNHRPLKGLVLGIDYGTKKVGFAIGDTFIGSAQPEGISLVFSFSQSLKIIQDKISEWHPVAVVLGLPMQVDGSDQMMSKKVKQVAEHLQQNSSCPIFFSDERYTTKVAQQMIKETGSKAKMADDWAATLILQCWLNQQK